mgnify:CR=1 FL=1
MPMRTRQKSFDFIARMIDSTPLWPAEFLPNDIFTVPRGKSVSSWITIRSFGFVEMSDSALPERFINVSGRIYIAFSSPNKPFVTSPAYFLSGENWSHLKYFAIASAVSRPTL